jgi:hypothetical protein
MSQIRVPWHHPRSLWNRARTLLNQQLGAQPNPRLLLPGS